MFTVEVFQAHGTGAPYHKFVTYSGVGISRSVGKAIKQAMEELNKDYTKKSELPECADMCIVCNGYTIKKNNKVILVNNNNLPEVQ